MYRASLVVFMNSSIYGRVACSIVYIYIFVCVVTAVVVHVPSIISSTHSKNCGRVQVACTFLPSGMMRDGAFLPCDLGLEFYISFREKSINQ